LVYRYVDWDGVCAGGDCAMCAVEECLSLCGAAALFVLQYMKTFCAIASPGKDLSGIISRRLVGTFKQCYLDQALFISMLVDGNNQSIAKGSLEPFVCLSQGAGKEFQRRLSVHYQSLTRSMLPSLPHVSSFDRGGATVTSS